jgi:hypothetical protein
LRGQSEQARLLLEILCEQGFAIPWVVLCLQQNLGIRQAVVFSGFLLQCAVFVI